MFRLPSLALIFCLATLMALIGCNKRSSSESDAPDEVATARKTPSPAANAAQLPAGHPPLPSASANPATMPAGHPPMPTTLPADGPISWDLPKNWTQQAGMSPRYAVIRPPADRPAELAVTVFPGNVGGTLANINRWRAQVGAELVKEADLEKNISRFDSNSIKIIVADIVGPKPEDPAMLAAIVPDAPADMSWFFKLVGAKDNVAKNKDEFIQLIKSIQLESTKHPTTQPATQPAK